MKPINANCCSTVNPVQPANEPITRNSHPQDIRLAVQSRDLTAPEHREVSYFYLKRSEESGWDNDIRAGFLQRAQIHATLALGQSTTIEPF